MRIVIPSYGRGDLLITNKIFPGATIVVPESQKEQYAHHKNVVTIADTLDGNISRKRNAVLDLFVGEDDILMLDDDIVDFLRFDPAS
jgi:hypothetical protein